MAAKRHNSGVLMFLHRSVHKKPGQTHLLSRWQTHLVRQISVGGHRNNKHHSSNAIIFFMFTAIITDIFTR